MTVSNPKAITYQGSDLYSDDVAYQNVERRGYDIGFKRSDAPANTSYTLLTSVVDESDAGQVVLSPSQKALFATDVPHLVASRDVTKTGKTSDWSAIPVEVVFTRVPQPPLVGAVA
jgi:hypothetical protein